MQTYLERMNKGLNNFLDAEKAAQTELAKIEAQKEFYSTEFYDQKRQEQLAHLETIRTETLADFAEVQSLFSSQMATWELPKGGNLTDDAALLRDANFNFTSGELTNYAEQYKHNATMTRIIHSHPNTPQAAKALFYGADARNVQFNKVLDVFHKAVLNKQINDNSQYLALINDDKFQGDIWLGHPALQDIEMLV